MSAMGNSLRSLLLTSMPRGLVTLIHEKPKWQTIGCDFFETRYGDLTPPGILVTENMTAQDIETMRENRRRSKKLIQYSITNKEYKVPR